MLSKQLIVASLAASAVAETLSLYTSSKNSDVDQKTFRFLHEGAGTNYVFLVSGEPTVLNYDESTASLSLDSSSFPQILNVDEQTGFVSIIPQTPTNKYTFEDSVLAVDGKTDVFYACKNTNDPYNYSETGYELMYYTSDAPSGCIAVTVQKSGKVGPNAGVSFSTTASASASAAPSSSSFASVVEDADESSTVASSTATGSSSHASHTSGSSTMTTVSSASAASASAVSSIASSVASGAANVNVQAPVAFGIAAGIAAALI